MAAIRILTSFPGGNSEWEPPDPISNSEVKTLSADGSVGSPHVRVGHRQDLFMKSRCRKVAAFFMDGDILLLISESQTFESKSRMSAMYARFTLQSGKTLVERVDEPVDMFLAEDQCRP